MNSINFSNGYALIIGVGFDLPVTVKDATALHDVLVDPGRAAYPKHQVEILIEAEANRAEIIAAFDRLIENVNRNPNATVIVYFSGHGGQIKQLNGKSEYFLLTHDYVSGQSNQGISGDEFTQKIQAINSRKLVVLLDCCHAAGMPAIKDLEDKFIKSPVPPSLLQALDTGRGRVVIASSREDEKSYTGDPYSIFTNCLLEALAGKATRNQDGFARILDIVTYLIEQVPLKTSDSSKYRSGQQHPFVNNISNLDENFALCYYAGGSKDVPTSLYRTPIVQLTSISNQIFKERKLKLLEEEIQHLQGQEDRIRKKIRKVENAKLDAFRDPILLDQYENNLNDLKFQIKELEDKLEAAYTKIRKLQNDVE